MSHSDAFQEAAAGVGSKFRKIDDTVIGCVTTAALDMFHYYDFVNRTVIVRVEQKDHINVIAFKDADAQTLQFMHKKLIALGGNPPPLPEKESARSLITKGQQP